MAAAYVNFTSIPVSDQDRAIAFYTENLGFSVHTDAPYGDDWRWIFLTLPGAQTKLQFSSQADMQINDKPALCLVCDDVDSEAEKLKSNGVEITGGPDDAPWGAPTRWLMIRDSEGNQVLLESLKEG